MCCHAAVAPASGNRPTQPDPSHAADCRVPAEVATRTVPRHREGDLLKRARNDSTVGTLVERLAVLVFFADPYSPWQHGSNDTTKGLLRPDLSKGGDLSRYTQREVNAIPIA